MKERKSFKEKLRQTSCRVCFVHVKCEGKDKLTSVFLGWCFSEATRFCCIALNKRISHVLEHGADPRSLVEPNMVLRECGQEPLQFFWFRASIRLLDSMLDFNSETLRRVLKADSFLALIWDGFE